MAEPENPRPLLMLPVGLAIGLVAAGAVLRVFASLTDFWLDEILTLDWARSFGFWGLISDPLTKHDNNHVLNSMWLRLVESAGEPSHWFPYRLLSITTGTVASAAMGFIGWRRSPVEGVIAAGFGALSFVLVHYSSECRGYAPVCCFALLSWIALERAFRRPGWGVTVALWVCAGLGMLSHSTYAFAYIGIGAWSIAAWRAGAPGATIPRLIRLHAFPVVVLALIYFLRIRGMVIGGGPEFGVPRALTNTLAHVVGWAWTGDWQGYLAAGVAVVLVASGCVLRVKGRAAGDSSWVFFVTLVVVVPPLVAFVLQPKIIFMRYFLVCVPFLMLLVAGLAAQAWRCCRAGRVAAIVLLVIVGAQNGWRLQGLLTAGRGHYLAALQYIVANDPSDDIRVHGNEELHIDRIIGFYNKFLDKKIRYVDLKAARQPGWLIFETQRMHPEAAEGKKISRKAFGAYYDEKMVYPYASMSGAHWYVLQRQN
jgi:hypothetical protein